MTDRSKHHDAPEVVPEATQWAASQPQQPYETTYQTKPEAHAAFSAYTPVASTRMSSASQHGHDVAATEHQEPPPRRTRGRAVFGGCTALVLVLSCIIGILSAAVIGLAAATGVEAKRANDAKDQMAALSAGTPSAPSTTSTAALDLNRIDNGCTNTPDKVNATEYKAFSFFGDRTFTFFCDLDTPHDPLMSLFTADFNTCMDACSAYDKYMPNLFGRNVNTTCAAVSFIPSWTSKAKASSGGAPGNCYLKPGPQSVDKLFFKDIGGPKVHGAILTSG